MKHSTLFFLIFISSIANGQMVKIKTFPQGSSAGPYYGVSAQIGNVIYFTANDGIHGLELWRTDGSTTGTYMVKDIRPGANGGMQGHFRYNDVSNMVVKQDTLFFAANDGVHGRELWWSVGTAAGTQMVKDEYVGPGGINPCELKVIDNKVFYFTDPDIGLAPRIFKCPYIPHTEGNGSFDQCGLDNPQTGTLQPNHTGFINNNFLFVASNTGQNGNEPWISDGTASGTKMLKNILPQPFFSSNPEQFTVFQGETYFLAKSSLGYGKDVWKTDGTESGTVKIHQNTINGNLVFNGMDFFSSFNNKLYFYAQTNQDYAIKRINNGIIEDINITLPPYPIVNQRLIGNNNGFLYAVGYKYYYDPLNPVYFQSSDGVNFTQIANDFSSFGPVEGNLIAIKTLNPYTIDNHLYDGYRYNYSTQNFDFWGLETFGKKIGEINGEKIYVHSYFDVYNQTDKVEIYKASFSHPVNSQVPVIDNTNSNSLSKGIAVCAGQTATLTAAGCTHSYFWGNQVESFQGVTTATIILPTGYTQMAVRCNDANNMKGKKRIFTVSYTSPSTPFLSSSPTYTCIDGTNYTLNAYCSGNTPVWQNGFEGGSLNFLPTITNNTFQVRCKDAEGCLGENREFKFYRKFNYTLSASQHESLGVPTTLTLTGCDDAPIIQWLGVPNVSQPNQTTVIVTPTEPTTYQVRCREDEYDFRCNDFIEITIPTDCPPIIQPNNLDPIYNSGTILKKSSGGITATNKITGTANVTYQAGSLVLLNPGFRADTGTTFKAQMGGCQ